MVAHTARKSVSADRLKKDQLVEFEHWGVQSREYEVIRAANVTSLSSARPATKY